MATVTENLRPASAENQAWTLWDPDFIDDEIEDPQADADGQSCRALTGDNGAEQIWRCHDRADDSYEQVTSLAVKVLAFRDGADTRGEVRLRVAGQWTDAKLFAPAESASGANWTTLVFNECHLAPQIDGLGVGVTARVTSGSLDIFALYVVVTGEAPLFDARDSLSVVDGTETVSLIRRSGEEATMPGALKRRLTTSEAAASDGRYTASDVTWHLSTDELAEPPAVGDFLRDCSGAKWAVLEVDESRRSGRWICRARKLEMAGGLDKTVRIQRATWSKGPSGDAVATWHDVLVNVPARIQPERTVVNVDQGRRDVTATHKIYLAVAIPLDEDHRIVHDEAAYRIVSQENAERIDQLAVVNAIEMPSAVNV